MTGFLNGIAVLIILGQLGDLTGFQSRFPTMWRARWIWRCGSTRFIIPTTIIGLLTLGLIVLLLRTRWRKFAFILAISAATLLLAVLSLPAFGVTLNWQSVRTVGDIAAIPRTLPGTGAAVAAASAYAVAARPVVAIIGLIQGAGVSQGYPNPDGKYPNVSRDFLGQGAANLAASLVSGVPAGGSISGTALLLSAGARSRWANILAGLFVALIVVVAAPLAELVPMPALAALLIVAGYQGLRIEAAQTIWRTGKVPATVMGLTFLATLFIPLQYAVLLGVAFSIVLYVAQQANKVVITEWVLVPEGFPVEQPAPRALPSHRITVLQVYGSLFFAAAKNLEEMLPTAENTTRAVIILGLRGSRRSAAPLSACCAATPKRCVRTTAS
jgi:SulP family sulfate permease